MKITRMINNIPISEESLFKQKITNIILVKIMNSVKERLKI